MRMLKTVEMREFDWAHDAMRLVEVASARRETEGTEIGASGRGFLSERACRRAAVRESMVDGSKNAKRVWHFSAASPSASHGVYST